MPGPVAAPPPAGFGGFVRPGFEAVERAFLRNFEEHGEHGAALCLYQEGELVVDLWGGWADAAGRQPWQADSLVNVFSVGKGVSAALVAALVSQGIIEVDRPVAEHWPAYASEGKAKTTLADLLSHRAGQPALRRRMPPGSMLIEGTLAQALAEEAPWWEPGRAHGYHVNTFGHLLAELLRRATGVAMPELLRQHLGDPLALDVHLGVPEPEEARVAEFLWPGEAPAEEAPALAGLELMRHNAYWNPSGLSGAGVVNTRGWRAACLPSTNMHASARGVARLYRSLLGFGEGEPSSVVSADVLARFVEERSAGQDLVLERPSRFGLGFQLTQPERPLGPGPSGFGHFGAGGSLGFCHPASGVAFGYVMNTLGPRWRNPRNLGLLEALEAALG